MQGTRVLADRYTLEEELGSGGAGSVWRASDEVLGRKVAIKLLHSRLIEDPETVERFRREAIAAASLIHPNIIVTHDIGEEDDAVYLVLELVDGPTLGDLITEHGPVDPPLVAGIGLQVARALAEAHRSGLVHRDIKPDNILLDRQGGAKVADFGISKALGAAQTRLTTPGTIVGTIAYLAPEQLAGEDVGAPVDVYALGLVLYECLVGTQPFDRDTAQAIAAARLTSEPPSPRDARPDVPDDLAEVVVRMTRRDPAERYANGAELVAALEPLAPAGGRDRLARFLQGGAGGRGEQVDETMRLPLEQEPTTRIDAGASERASGNGTPLGDAAASTAAHTAAIGEPNAPAQGATTDAGTAERPESGTQPQPSSRPQPDAQHEREPEPRPERAPADGDEGRRRLSPAGIVAGLVGLALIVIIGTVLVRSGGDPGQPQGGDGGDVAAIEVADASDIDPFGDGEEHREEVPNAFDGDTSTAWGTERYNSDDLGGLKPGVGVWFVLEESRSPRAVDLVLPYGGTTLELYALDGEPSGDPGSWGEPVGRTEDASGEVRLEVPEGTSATHWLVWITGVGDGGGRAGIAEIRFVR